MMLLNTKCHIQYIHDIRPFPDPQDTREGYPYHGRTGLGRLLSSMVRIPLAGILGRGRVAYVPVHGRGTPRGYPGSWRICMLIALLALALLFILPIPTPSAYAATATTGKISGQLLNGTQKNAPLAGQSVTLQMAQGNTAQDVTTVKTDARGAYSFANLGTASDLSYALYTNYQGAQYISNVVTLNSKPAQSLNLTVYEATASMSNIAIVRATVLLRTPDVKKGLVSVSELFIFRNLNARTYVGSLDASHGKPNALLFSLPHTATNVSLGKGFDGYTAIQVDHGFAANAAVPPGDSQFAFTFDMPYTTADYDFDYTVQYPTVQLMLLLPPTISAASSTLKAQGQVKATSSSLNLFQATALTSNQVVHLELSGLPTITPVTTGNPASVSASPATPWLLIGLAAMLAILVGTWLVYRTMRRPAPTNKQAESRKRTAPKGQAEKKSEKVPS